ncbi:MAG: 2-oxoacid ferredoxin oxidoreductase [Parcubacteria group bacterium CG23_combo_of_CG06-09_8_20_14_all_35_6]|nr:MAG: 2-oxoacid ferredoxin oxidoreductase [Parcubacteria group bacterium CG23_combo_of_CG06-09_8_20_14_all_35_6]
MNNEFRTQAKIIWCQGCGNFGILTALENAFKKLGLSSNQIAAVYGIGCHGHMANYLKVYNFEGIHGRALPIASGIKIANKKLKVISIVGDGDQLGEGANHLVHASKRNSDITCLIHNNQIYSLTVGQASPTSEKGIKTKTTPQGVVDQQLNPLALAIASGATFVARSFAGDIPYLTEVLVQAINHKGFSLVDILQPCISLNHINTFTWYRERIYKLEETKYSPNDKNLAFAKSLEWGEKIPIGVFYREQRLTLEDQLLNKDIVLADQALDVLIKDLLKEFL